MMRWLVAGSLAACAEPKLLCADLTTAQPGASCTYPERAIAIDGDLADWDAVPQLDPTCTVCHCVSCTTGQVVTLRATRTADDNVALLVETSGEPLAGSQDSYFVTLFPLQGPQYGLSLRLVANEIPAMTLDGAPIAGLPVQASFGTASPAGAHGIELALPIAILPFGGGFGANAELDHLAQSAQTQVPTIGTCWDATAPLCQPR